MFNTPENMRVVRTLHLTRGEVCRLIVLLDSIEDYDALLQWESDLRDKLKDALKQYDRIRAFYGMGTEHDS